MVLAAEKTQLPIAEQNCFPRLLATHKRAEAVSGPPQSPTRSLKVSGSQTDLLTPWCNERAGIIRFQYSPGLLGGKGRRT